jgi:hypothetical protein
MCVVAELALKGRAVTYRSLDLYCLFRRTAGEDIGIEGEHHLGRRLWVAAEDRLAPDHDDLGLTANTGGGAYDVLELLAPH